MADGWRSEQQGWTPASNPSDPGPAVLQEVPDLAPLVRAALAKRVPRRCGVDDCRSHGRWWLAWHWWLRWPSRVELCSSCGVGQDQWPLISHYPSAKIFSPAPRSSVASSAGLVVEVVGRVHRPGVLTLPKGSRVVDAVQAAGGVLTGTDTTSLGLAQKLSDGQQIRVGLPGVAPGPISGAAGGTSGPLELNSATEAALDTLPGVGPVLAARIVAWREAHGGFTSVGQLKSVQGLSGKKGDELVALVSVG